MAAFGEAIRPRQQLLPHGELDALRGPIRRTTAIRLVLGLALLASLFGALLVALDRDARPDPLLPPGTTGMIVLDLSASAGIQPQVGELFRRVAAADDPSGLIVFSDVAYELVPPGTPGRHLQPLIRFFVASAQGGVKANPWSAKFSAGTRISAGISAAHSALLRDEIERGTIVVVSDLEVFDDDLVRIPALLTALRGDGIDLRILPLGAREESLRYFRRVVGPDAFITVRDFSASGTGAEAFRLAEERMPWLFLAIGALLAVLLAANERLAGRLELPARAKEATA
jgi:hypothetical protein